MTDDPDPRERTDDRRTDEGKPSRNETEASSSRDDREDPGPDTVDAGHRDTEGGIARRTLLAALSAGPLVGSAGCAGLLEDEETPTDGPETTISPGTPTGTPEPEYLFEVWKEVRAAVRTSPSHLPARAEALVEAGDAEGAFELVRDDILTLPADKHRMGDNNLVRWG